MQGRLREILEDENPIKLLETKLYTLERGDLDLRKRDHSERRIRKVDQAVGCRLQPNVGAEWYTFEREFSERKVGFKGITSLWEQFSISDKRLKYETH